MAVQLQKFMPDEDIGKIITKKAQVVEQRVKDAEKAGTFLTKSEALGDTHGQMVEKGLLKSSAKGTEGMKTYKLGQTQGVKEKLGYPLTEEQAKGDVLTLGSDDSLPYYKPDKVETGAQIKGAATNVAKTYLLLLSSVSI